MSHEVESMFSVKEVPWHGLGKIVAEAPNITEAIKLAGLDWNVKMMPLQTVEGAVPVQRRAIVRETDNRVYGVVGKDYHPLQNSEAFDWFTPFLDSGECTLQTAGSLRQGEKVWVLAKLNRDPMEIAPGDVVDKYLLLSNGHNGFTAATAASTPIRVVCANTLQMAMTSKDSKIIRASHFSNVKANLEKIREIINTANGNFEATAEQYRALAKRRVSSKDVADYVKIVFFSQKDMTERRESRLVEMTNTITELFESGRGNDMAGVRGTAWALYNGVTEYLSYEAGKSQDTRLDSLWFGSNGRKNAKAFSAAMDLVVA